MSKRIICDRCGMQIDDQDVRFAWSYEKYAYKEAYEADYSDLRAAFDLCPLCHEAIVKRFNNYE